MAKILYLDNSQWWGGAESCLNGYLFDQGVVRWGSDGYAPYSNSYFCKYEIDVFRVIFRYSKLMRWMPQAYAIASSSLHGIIGAVSPVMLTFWEKFSDGVIGDGFKFRDYFSGAMKSVNNMLYVVDTSSSIEDIWNSCQFAEFFDYKYSLLSTCPFLHPISNKL